MKKYILIIIPILLTSCWFNPNDKAWIDPIVMKFSEYDFKTERDSTDWFMTYIGEQETVSYKFADTKEWLSIENYHGHINKDEQKLLKFYIDRNKLAEGINEDTIKVYINEKHERHIIIKATGDAALEITPKEIDFGISMSSTTLSIKSLCGRRTYIVSSPDNWLSTENSANFITINKDETVEIDIFANRSILDTGTHQGIINIKSNKNQFNQDITVYITITEQNELTQVYDCYIFTIKKSYRYSDNDVKVEFDIENTSEIYRSLSFSAIAVDFNGNRYKSHSSNNIKKKSTINETITFYDIPQELSNFEKIIFIFNPNNEIIFNNISF